MQILEADELRRFLTQAQYNGFYEIFMLDVATGMRRGELLALQWDDVNLQTGELKIKRQVTRTKGMLLVSETKTKASERVIVLPPSVVSMLSEYRTKVDSRWIFPSPVKEDSSRDPQTVYKRMQEILVRAGCKRVRFHDIRHTFAMVGVPWVSFVFARGAKKDIFVHKNQAFTE
jgi:integrase